MVPTKTTLFLVLAIIFAIASFAVAKKTKPAELSDEQVAAKAFVDLLKVASKAKIETFKNNGIMKPIKKNKRSTVEAEADTPGFPFCKNLGSLIGYSGSYEQCWGECSSYGKIYFLPNTNFQISWFPRGSWSSGGCSCCGASKY